MMFQLDLKNATELFNALPVHKQNPYFHPEYVALDAKSQGSKEIYFGGRVESDIFLFSGLLTFTDQYQTTDIESPRGYGGLLTTEREGSQRFVNAYLEYRKWLSSMGVLVEFCRFHPLLQNHLGYDGKTFINRTTCAISLDQYQLNSHGSRSIRYIKKAIKAEAQIEINERPSLAKLNAFSDLYRERMDELSGMAQYRFDDYYFEALFELSIKTVLAEVFVDGELVAASIFIGAGSTLEYHLSCSNDRGRGLGATNFLLHQVALHYQNEYSVIHLGGGLSDDPNDPLFQFKASVGKHLSDFYIGGHILDRVGYERLKSDLNTDTNRIIFYRD
ncbi:GNAT family N-acetyltransferase [Marinomonas communis]|uniref:GNAT family N-acetyltransferase n=1 Tax=Marinomonas communis TaxID=28254 RepID=UPI001D18C29D|nr:GNAT family N-acetyltransferase [Marinomonas communis]MCC4274508.1 GNAT family N-acetyltransferase [Marinomonas communis]